MIVPMLNERPNIEPLLAELERALAGIRWEACSSTMISPDGAWALLQDLQRQRAQVRVLRRVGRRGLAWACSAGMRARSGNRGVSAAGTWQRRD